MKDAEICCRWVSNPQVHQYLGLLHPVRTVEQERSWIASLLTDKQHQRSFIIEDQRGHAIGTCGLRGIDAEAGTAFLGIMIGEPKLWGKGYGTAAVRALLALAFDELALKDVRLSCHRDNRRALRCYEKVGFRLSSHKPDQVQFGHREIRMAISHDKWLAHRQEPAPTAADDHACQTRSQTTPSDT
jgi:RimJ/RimL family protein N-acetyltransferase